MMILKNVLYFFIPKYTRNTSMVKLENGNRVSEPKQIEKELEKFYSNMYTSKNLKSEFQGENKSLSLLLKVLKSLNWMLMSKIR